MIHFHKGMPFGDFTAMLAGRPCPHPFDVTGLETRYRRTPAHIMVKINYRCPRCGKLVGTSTRDLRR